MELMEKFPVLSMGKKGHTGRTKIKVCYVCGHRGFSDLLIYCAVCSNLAVHKYCLGIVPGSIEDDENFYWACECCCPMMRSEPTTTQMSGALMIDSESEIIPVEDQPKPICTLVPIIHSGSSELAEQSNQSQKVEWILRDTTVSMYKLLKDGEQPEAGVSSQVEYCEEITSGGESISGNHYSQGHELYDDLDSQIAEETQRFTSRCINHSLNYKEEPEAPISSFMECPKEIMSGLVLLVSPSGETIIRTGLSFCDDPLFSGAPVASLMEYPKEIMSGLVLVASPSGEVIIRSNMSLSDDSHSPSLATSSFIMANSSDDTSLDELVTKLGPLNSKDLAPTLNKRIAECDDMSYFRECKRARREKCNI